MRTDDFRPSDNVEDDRELSASLTRAVLQHLSVSRTQAEKGR